MASTSVNLSDRIFFTVCYIDGTAYIGELESSQKILVNLTNEELIVLCKFLQSHDVLNDITPEDYEEK